MATYRDLELIGEISISFLKENGRWYIEVYDQDCTEGDAPDLLLDEKYTDEEIEKIVDKWIPNTMEIEYY